MNIKYEETFDWFEDDARSRVFQIFPGFYTDNRGYFMEVVKDGGVEDDRWMMSTSWIKQINRSVSRSGVIRGCHCQKGGFCQGKMVESVNEHVFDIITDARPNSGTFGVTTAVLLNSEIHNKLWVPRGFLHAFVVPMDTVNDVIFEYMCDNVYNSESEICVNPKSILPRFVDLLSTVIDSKSCSCDFTPLFELMGQTEKIIYSEKDLNGFDYNDFMNNIQKDFVENGKLWYI